MLKKKKKVWMWFLFKKSTAQNIRLKYKTVWKLVVETLTDLIICHRFSEVEEGSSTCFETEKVE